MTLAELDELTRTSTCRDRNSDEVRIGDLVRVCDYGAALPHSLVGSVGTVVGVQGKNAQIRFVGNPEVWPRSLPGTYFCLERPS